VAVCHGQPCRDPRLPGRAQGPAHPHAGGAAVYGTHRRVAGVRPSVLAMLVAMTGTPAVVRNDRLDILATNALGRALYSELNRNP